MFGYIALLIRSTLAAIGYTRQPYMYGISVRTYCISAQLTASQLGRGELGGLGTAEETRSAGFGTVRETETRFITRITVVRTQRTTHSYVLLPDTLWYGLNVYRWWHFMLPSEAGTWEPEVNLTDIGSTQPLAAFLRLFRRR